mgnify:CR=1 FL=1
MFLLYVAGMRQDRDIEGRNSLTGFRYVPTKRNERFKIRASKNRRNSLTGFRCVPTKSNEHPKHCQRQSVVIP